MAVEEERVPTLVPILETMITEPTAEPLPSVSGVAASDQDMEPPIPVSRAEVINEEPELLAPFSESVPVEVDVSM